MIDPAEKSFDTGDLARLLVAALGRERADQAIRDAISRLEFPSRGLTWDQTRAVLGLLAASNGVIGIAGRVALQRLENDNPESSKKTPRGPELSAMTVAAIVELFVPSVGNEKATDAVRANLARLGIQDETLTGDQVTELLERMAQVAGIVGTVARFARARLLLGGTGRAR